MPLKTLLSLVNAERTVLDESSVTDRLHEMGVEVEEITLTSQSRCSVCGKIIERTEAQGPPLACSNCGTDYRERPDAMTALGDSKVIRLDMLAVRPDIFDPGGMARYMRGYLGVQTGLSEYALAPAQLRVKVDHALGEDESYRPFIACAVLRGVHFDDDRIKILMNAQEDLHWALGRDRKLASIGVYDLDSLRGTTFHYDAVAADELKFVPLGFSPDAPGSLMTPGEILRKHKTGIAYARLLEGYKKYPVLRDGEDAVLSMPPIINSEATRVTHATRNCFVDVTGLSRRTVDRALNVLVTGLAEIMPEMRIEAVTIDGLDGELVTPNLAPVEMPLELRNVNDTIGMTFEQPRLVELLERMGHGVAVDAKNALSVSVPAWRNDVMHPVDLIEDVAIAHGYENIAPALIPTFTVGAPRQIEEQASVARSVFTGLGFHQVMTLTLTSESAAFEKWGVTPHERAVRIENPISSEQTICRVNLLGGLLETLAINKQYDLPQNIFEIGDCSFVDAESETGAREERFAAAAMIGTHVGYADIRAVADAFTHEMTGARAGPGGADLSLKPIEHPAYIAGRVAELERGSDCRLGLIGEVHPQVLERYGLKHPVSVLELNLSRLLGL